MTRTEYRKNRRLLRDNGGCALRWMKPEHAEVFRNMAVGKDKLAERAAIVAYCRRESVEYNFRHLA